MNYATTERRWLNCQDLFGQDEGMAINGRENEGRVNRIIIKKSASLEISELMER